MDGLTREALADVAAGRTITNEEMERRYDEILFPWLEQRAKELEQRAKDAHRR